MTVFEEMWTPGKIGHRELQEIEAMVSQTIERGFVLEVPVVRKQQLSGKPFERWFMEKESGVIFALIYFTERSYAKWERVLPAEIKEFSQTIH